MVAKRNLCCIIKNIGWFRRLIFIDRRKDQMSNIAAIIGQRIRAYRVGLGLSQEKLAELSGVHPTYIGQLERGEKNATLESIAKISAALGVSLSTLLEHLGAPDSEKRDIPLECYNMIASKKPCEQERLFNILKEIAEYNK